MKGLNVSVKKWCACDWTVNNLETVTKKTLPETEVSTTTISSIPLTHTSNLDEISEEVKSTEVNKEANQKWIRYRYFYSSLATKVQNAEKNIRWMAR